MLILIFRGSGQAHTVKHGLRVGDTWFLKRKIFILFLSIVQICQLCSDIMQECCITKATDVHFKDTEKGEKEERKKEEKGNMWRREVRGSEKRESRRERDKEGEREIEKD